MFLDNDENEWTIKLAKDNINLTYSRKIKTTFKSYLATWCFHINEVCLFFIFNERILIEAKAKDQGFTLLISRRASPTFCPKILPHVINDIKTENNTVKKEHHIPTFSNCHLLIEFNLTLEVACYHDLNLTLR